jgi:hypothetical protein
MENISGLHSQAYDCCIDSCTAFTGAIKDAKQCPYCRKARYDATGKSVKQFHYLPLIPRLQNLYAGEKTSKLMLHRSETHDARADSASGTISDVYDTELYSYLRNTHVTLDNKILPYKFFQDGRDVLLMLMTDGFNIFRRGKRTCWPIIILNGNLPPTLRYNIRNIICLGVIPGPTKPRNFNSFFFPLVLEGRELALGINAFDAHSKQGFKLRAYLSHFGGDMPAVAQALMMMKGVNSLLPCRACDIVSYPTIETGKATRKGKERAVDKGEEKAAKREKATLYVPLRRPEPQYLSNTKFYDATSLPARQHDRFISQARQVMNASNGDAAKRYGINGLTIFAQLPSVRFPASFPHDFMHLFKNTMDGYLDLWTGKFKGLDDGDMEYQLADSVWKDICRATTEAGDTIPSAFGRRIPHFIDNRGDVTAESLLVWTTLYAPILLRGRFPHNRDYKHFRRFLRIVERLLAFSTTQSDRDTLRRDIIDWHCEYETSVHEFLHSKLN